MWLIYVFSIVCAVTVVYSITGIVRGSKVIDDPNATKGQSLMALSTLLFVGSLGLLSTIPGIFTGDWYWFTDKVFALVAYVI